MRGLFAQDPIHVSKKLDCKLDSAKVLEMGFFTCCHSHLQEAYNVDSSADAVIRRGQRDGNSSGLWRTDVYKQDRQNFMACVRRSGYKLRRALVQMQPKGALNMLGVSPRQINRIFLPDVNADPDTMPVIDAVFLGADDRPWGSDDRSKPIDIKTQGTVSFYILCAAYILIHHSQYFGILQRVRFAGFVNMFAAHWRCWVMKTAGYTLGANFLTKECYTDLIQSCHEAVFQTIVFAKYAPSLPLRLNLSGSNVCENSFSAAGGYRGMHGHRSYTFLDYLNYVEREYVMHVLSAAGVQRGRSQHSKQEWDSRCHEPRIAQDELDNKLRQHPTLVAKVRSWNAGTADASHLAKTVGLKHGIDDQAWDDPWSAMREKLHVAEVNNDSSSSESSDDDDDYLRPFEAPKKPTCCSLDVRIVLMQIFRQRFPFKDKTVVSDTVSKSIPVVSLYLFHPVCDLDCIDELLTEVYTEETVVERKERRPSDRIN